MNNVEIRGGLVRDPTLTITDRNVKVCNLTVAVSGARYDYEARQQVVTTVYVSVVFFGDVAERIAGDVAQGDEVWIKGELDQSVVETKDGKKDRKTKVVGFVYGCTRRTSGVAAEQRRRAAGPTDEEPF